MFGIKKLERRVDHLYEVYLASDKQLYKLDAEMREIRHRLNHQFLELNRLRTHTHDTGDLC